MGIFKRPCVVRIYGEQQIIGGYGAAPYAEQAVMLDVQPVSNDAQGLPEGERREARVRTFGQHPFHPADQYEGKPGDRLLYGGRWFECVRADKWDYGPLAHYNSEFVSVPEVE
jgi:hypothetical protein